MFDIISIVKTAGYLGIFGIIFAESGLFFGFFLPGDSLLFTAGVLASQGFMNIWVLLLLNFIAAVLGDSFGYFFGNKIGKKIFIKEESFFFKKAYIEKSRVFFERHGAKAIILARFIPVIRTFTPILAGVGHMPYQKFLSYNLVGGFIWVFGLTLLGYFLGVKAGDIDKYLLPIITLIILSSFIPVIMQIFRKK